MRCARNVWVFRTTVWAPGTCCLFPTWNRSTLKATGSKDRGQISHFLTPVKLEEGARAKCQSISRVRPRINIVWLVLGRTSPFDVGRRSRRHFLIPVIVTDALQQSCGTLLVCCSHDDVAVATHWVAVHTVHHRPPIRPRSICGKSTFMHTKSLAYNYKNLLTNYFVNSTSYNNR